MSTRTASAVTQHTAIAINGRLIFLFPLRKENGGYEGNGITQGNGATENKQMVDAGRYTGLEKLEAARDPPNQIGIIYSKLLRFQLNSVLRSRLPSLYRAPPPPSRPARGSKVERTLIGGAVAGLLSASGRVMAKDKNGRPGNP